MTIEISKLKFLLIYYFSRDVILSLINLLNLKNYNLNQMNLLTYLILCFSTFPAIIYLGYFSKKYLVRGIYYYILRSIFPLIELFYFIFNMLGKKNMYAGFKDVIFSPESINSSFYIYLGLIVLNILYGFYIGSQMVNSRLSQEDKDKKLALFCPSLYLIKKTYQRYKKNNKDDDE
ncbi:hypothetical protein CPAV1605_1486 [seawater metagenome]|uniref:Uncharacterized protein n=1 Tax=seawater metagenome TaxID=1561972 RepID=A0A5E8CKH3_9ZZZZ